jgi:hypothetical protein
MDFSKTKLYDWVDFFSELSKEIEEIGKSNDRDSLLFTMAQKSFGEDSAICKYEYVDPFSFIYFLAQRNTANQKTPVYSKVKDTFSLEAEIPSDIIFPTPTPNSTSLFHDGENFNNDFLWEMYSIIISGNEIADDDFLKFLGLKSVGCSKLTQTMFLINPKAYLPIDNNLFIMEDDQYFSLSELKKAIDQYGYTPYKQAMEDVSGHFPGCYMCEINLFSYMIKSKHLQISENCFQIGSNVYGGSKNDDSDYIEEFYIESGVWVGGPTSGGNQSKEYPILEPDFGDIILSHINHFGNGVGIVLHNEYKESQEFNENSKINVIWICKEERPNCLNASQMPGMSRAFRVKDSFLDKFPETKKILDSISTDTTLIDDNIISRSSKSMKNLNRILYGPPGTGKTYKTISLAAEIIEGEPVEDYIDAIDIFNDNLGSRIEFITFHQNYSYEDFIQGLRPDTDNNNSLNFERKDGVFHRIATDALFEYYKEAQKRDIQPDTAKEKKIGEIYLDFLEYLKHLKDKSFKTINNSIVHVQEINKNKNILLHHGSRSKTYIVSVKRLMKLFGAYPDIKMINNVNNDIRDVIGGCNSTMYWVILREFIKYYNEYKIDIDEESTSDENLEEIEYESKKELLSTFDLSTTQNLDPTLIKNYVIIIDEINRANISRVFGELITLIEPDKRSHGEIPLRCTLPSGEEFIVPSNLFIIGTMNTADKSIALLDIALRRRFVFVPMYPKYKIPGHEIHDVVILQKINEEIVKRKGHDFQIGHSYFMGSDYERAFNMNNKVIPLLLEYFMNDEKEVIAVLKAAELHVKENAWPIELE